MRRFQLVLLPLLACCVLIEGCEKSPKDAPQAPVTSGDAASQAEHASGKIAILISNVTTANYENGTATSCQVTYTLYNNTDRHLFKAENVLGGYSISIGEIPANSHISDQTSNVDPVGGSCAGVIESLMKAGAAVSTTDCSMEGMKEGECQATVASFVGLTPDFATRVREQDRRTKAEFEQQDLADQHAKRDRYELADSAVLTTPAFGAQVEIPAVTAVDFDPTKISADTPIETSTVTFCPPDSSGSAQIGRLVVNSKYTDKYNLAVWYKLLVFCGGRLSQAIFVQAQSLNNLRDNQQLMLASQ
jgi:hypothetical protein